MADDDMPPPLEDMSATLEQAKRLRDIKLGTQSHGRAPNTVSKTAFSQQSSKANSKDTQQKPSPSPAKSSQSNPPKVTETSQGAKPSSNKKTGSGDFGGMKKGFLFGGSSKSSSASQAPKTDSQKVKSDSAQSNRNQQTDSIPFIKPKAQEKDSGLKLDEVQQAMESTKGFLQDKDWVTEDLLEKVQKNESLGKRLGDPRFMQAVTEFQTNPMEAMSKYQNNPEMQQFLKEFCGILGEHFSALGEKEDSSTTTQRQAPVHTGPKITEVTDEDIRASSYPHDSASPVDPHVQQILSDPANREILTDPKVQQLIQHLRSNPEKAQKMLKEGDTALRQKVDRLISLGLLKFQG